MRQVKDIFTCTAEWQKKLRNCKYAGEVYLDPELLERLAREFRQFMIMEDSQYETALVVLAVNCAYHYYDDQGFWPHFCRILKIENTSANQERIGKIIEKRLEKLGLKKRERTGPFRYVGAILEQCGISKRYITPLAGIIKELKGSRSWNYLLKMGQMEFQERVEILNCSHYLKNFLKDDAGWIFTMQVCHLLMLYEQGFFTLADLRELPGYQPGFWDEFLVHFHDPHLKQMKNRVPIVLKPRLVFVPEERCLAIRFPGRDYADGVKFPAIPNFWQFPLTLLKPAEAWSDYYTGSIPGPEGRLTEWTLSGWLPDGLPALFDPRYGFVQRGRKVKPGEYYLLIPDGYHPTCRVISELGPVRVPGNINYRACRVLVESGTTIHGYELEPNTGTDIVLAWVEPERFRLWCADPWLDVFSESLPPLSVSDFRLVEEQRVAMFYTAGSVSGRIRNRRDLEQFLKEINGKAPVAGRFSVIAVGRTGTPEIGSIISEIEFYLLPRTNIKFTQRLYGFNEEPAIEIDDTFPGRLNLDGCRRVGPGSRKWIVPSAISRVTGTVECRGLVVDLNIPVYRARLYFADGKPVRYLLLTDLEQETAFLLTGCPDFSARLGLWQQPARQIPVKFGSNGLVRISSGKLLELARDSSYSISEVVLSAGEYTVSTGAVIIDLASVAAGVCTGTGYRACVCTAGDLTRILDMCTEICRGVAAGRRYNLNRIPRFNPSLDEWIFSLFACTGVFDEVDILVSGKKVDWTGQVKNEQLRRHLEFIIKARTGRWTGLPAPAAEKELLLSVERWQKALNQALMPYRSEEEVPGLSEWADEVRRHHVWYRSGIARLTGGQLLSTAWVHYHRNLFENAVSHLNNIKGGPPLITGLRDFLHVLLLLRLARIESARKLIESREPGGILEVAFLLLQYALSIFYGEKPRETPEARPGLLTQLPLRAEDETFLELVARALNNPAEVEANPPDTRDWLLLWFLVNLCSNQQKKAELARKLLQHGDQIPASPEKIKILDRLMKLAEVK